MTTNGQELTLFGGWAKVRTLKVIDAGVSKSLAVTSHSTSRIELRSPIPPHFSTTRKLLFTGCGEATLLVVTKVVIVDEDYTHAFAVSNTAYSSEKVYQPVGRWLWKKVQRFYASGFQTQQMALFHEYEDSEIEPEIRVGLTVSPITFPTDQTHMIWIARLELRKRIMYPNGTYKRRK